MLSFVVRSILLQGDVLNVTRTLTQCIVKRVVWYNKKHLLVFPGKTSRDEAMFILSLLMFTLT